jgi:hypothetical protein
MRERRRLLLEARGIQRIASPVLERFTHSRLQRLTYDSCLSAVRKAIKRDTRTLFHESGRALPVPDCACATPLADKGWTKESDLLGDVTLNEIFGS